MAAAYDAIARDYQRSKSSPLRAAIECWTIDRLLGEFRRLRLTDETIYLRNAAVNLINGMINMSFSCDGTHYIDHKTFFAKLDDF